jgi:Eukaryotic mitochondrial regulator protein
MFSWLNGPGQNFRYPVHNSTNYLTAYDRSGKPIEQNKSQGPDSADTRALDKAAEGSKTLTRPFPLNRHFFSQPVLSNALRNEIWKRVKVDGKSVRTVSVEMGVEMRRVGAVVRLVEVEKRMRKEVCLLPMFSLLHKPFVMNSKSISLPDNHMVI